MDECDWLDWHGRYDDPGSALSGRLAAVQSLIRTFLAESRSGDLQVVSACAGQGRDLLGVLADHPRRREVRARLVELDRRNAALARATARDAGLGHVQVVEGDAALTDAYAGAVPADLVLMCGVFGNISDDDVKTTVRQLSRLCATDAAVIWTRGRRDPDLTPQIRGWFDEAGFEERAFESPGADSWAVGMHRLRDDPRPLEAGRRLFEFRRRGVQP